MTLDVFRSLQSFAVARPPLLTFIISLLAIIFTLFITAIYIKSSDRLPNIHVEEDWKNFLGQLTKEKYCIAIGNQSYSSSTESVIHNASSAYETIVFPVNISLSSFNTSFLQSIMSLPDDQAATFLGSIVLTDWKPSCGRLEDKLDRRLTLHLTIPSASFHNVSTHETSCLTVLGHHNLFPSDISHFYKEECSEAKGFKKIAGNILTSLAHEDSNVNRSVDEKCGGGVFVALDILQPKVQLNLDDIHIILSHLIYAVYIVLALIVLFICIGVIQGRNALRNEHHLIVDKEPISS